MEFNLADLFEAVADAVPDREMLVCDDLRLTFAGFDERATRLAHALADQGVGTGDHVGLHLHNGNEYLEGMLACFKLRAVPVNVSYRYVADELRYLFADAGLKAVVCEPQFQRLLDESGVGVPRIERGAEYEAALAGASPGRDFGPRRGDDVYILYTGGTTGMPKGVMWRHEDIFFAAMGGGNPGGPAIAAPQDVVARAEAGFARCLPAPPLMHGAAHWMAWQVMLAGGSLVVARDPRLDPGHVWGLVERERVTFLVIVGDAFARPLVDALEGAAGRWDLSSLTVILSGGAILSPAVKEQLAVALPGVIMVDGYGSSETGGQGQRVAAAGHIPSRPTFHVGPDTQVLDDEGRPVPPGSDVTGWVARRGHIPLGYYGDAEKTAATFPTYDGVRWAVPGDRAMVEADGSIVVLGRGSVLINTGGEKVYPEEVEAVLKGHPAIWDAVVVGVPDERFGERVAAVVAPREGAEPPSLEDVGAWCRRSLAGYKAPRQLVVVGRVVRSPSGKPDYRWARALAVASAEL